MAKGRGFRLLSAGIAAIALSLAPAVSQAAAQGASYDLGAILQLADKNHPNIVAARAKLDQVRAQLDEAKTAPFSQFRMSGGVGLAPTVLGNNVFSPNTDVSLTSSLGLAWRASIEGVVPLWTFGKVTNLWDAASANVRVNQAAVEKERDTVRLDVRRAYFGLQLARDSALLLRDVRKEIDKAAARLQESVDADEGDPIELLKLQTYAAELEVREAEVQRYTTIALAGLRFFAGVPNLDIPDAPLKPPAHKLGHVTRYLAAARLYRPELAMARAGIDARTAQVNLARAQLFPDIGIGLNAGFARAPEVANQINPFTNDPGNFFWYGAAFVFQWKLDALPQTARIRFAEAQLEEVRALERYALGGAGVEVETAYAEVLDWQKRLEAYSKASSYARRWLVMIQQGIDVGTREEKEVLDPAKAYATNRFNLLNATMELDLAMSRLAKATGWDAIAPDGG
jgi:outer membrane protein TolC